MKVQERVLDVVSTLEGEKVDMSIDTTALSHIMGVLTDLYSDPEMAVIREYSTNAFDAHVESNVKRPIEVTLPSALAPFFKVRDFGEGLNAADIRDIYSRYGASTKRNSDDVVGMLGLGCKSALTYTDQFTIVGIKNGIKTQVVVSRDEDGAGSMTIVDQAKTDDIQGVEITVPVATYNKFEQKAEEFFRYWQKDKVLINGKPPKPIGGIWIADDLLLSTEVDKPHVVMGNVAYPVDSDRGYGHAHHYLVAFVDIGDINFVPSREALQMTSRTKATLANIKERESLEKVPALERVVEGSPTRHEAIDNLFKCRSLGLQKNVKWNGSEIPVKFEGEFVNVDTGSYYKSRNWSFVKEVPSNTNAIWLTGYDSDKFTPHKTKKLEKWIENKKFETNPRRFILTDKLPADSAWIDKKKIYDWQEVKDTIVESDSTKGPKSDRPTGSYDAFIGTVSTLAIEADKLSRKHLFYIHSSVPKNKYGYHPRPAELSPLLELHPDATLVTLTANRIAKFQRDFPMAQDAREYIRAKASAWEASISKEDRIANTMHKSGDYDLLRFLDPEKVDDPKLIEAIGLFGRNIQSLLNSEKNWRNWVRVKGADWKNPLEAYPLAANLDLTYRGLSDIVKAELHLYLNAAYAARKEGK